MKCYFWQISSLPARTHCLMQRGTEAMQPLSLSCHGSAAPEFHQKHDVKGGPLVAGAWTERKKCIHVCEEKTLFQLKKWLFLTSRMDTSNARNKNLRPLFNTNIPPISGKYGLRTHFWSLESGFLMRKREENDFFSKSAKDPILSFWILNVHIIICQFQKRSTVIHFFSLSPCSCH